eukprot:Skav226867  [mRNA]  locus=scaffold1187:75612:77375:+ [translate_table: standard]
MKPIAQEVGNTYSQLTHVTSGNTTVPNVERKKTHGSNVGAFLCAVILLLCPAGLCGRCAWDYVEFSKAGKKEYEQLQQTRDTEGDVSAKLHPSLNWCYPWVSQLWNFDGRELGEILHQEVLLMLMCPVLALLAAPWTTCEEGSPSWIYIVYLPVLARSKWAEFQLMLSRQVNKRCPLDHRPRSTLGIEYLIEGILKAPFFSLSDRPSRMKRLGGEWTCSTWLAFALWGPLDHVDWFTDGSAPHAGPRGAQRPHELRPASGGFRRQRGIVVGFSKVALENVPQLLQSSFLALVFDELTPLGRSKVLFSVLLGLLSASQKILEAMMLLVKSIRRRGAQWNWGQWCLVCVASASFMLAPVAVLWTIIKLYFVFHCDTHMWNVGNGCVEWS